MNDRVKEIKAIKDKYDLLIFSMGLTHLIDVGIRHLDEKSVEESIKQIMATDEAEKASGKTPILSPEFQCEIVRCAAELAHYSPMELMKYIKKYVVISNLQSNK